MNKKGSGGVDWFIVTIIISVLTLVVFVLIAIFFPFSDVIDRSACKESVVLRAALPSEVPKTDISVNVKDYISLRCKTRDICITLKSGKGNCTDLGKDFETKRLTGTNEVEIKEQIRMFLSREMADCWDMFGEGKLQIFAREFDTTGFTAKGIICDKIEFDNSVTEGDYRITELKDLTLYMATHKVPNQNYSYLDYLRGTPEGETAKNLYGPLVKSNADITSFKSGADVLPLTNVKSIVYIESTLTNFGQRLGAAVGGSAGAVGSFMLRGFGLKFLTGGGLILGSSVGDTITRWIYKDTLCSDSATKEYCGNHVGGLVLTDYSSEGFNQWNIASFENL